MANIVDIIYFLPQPHFLTLLIPSLLSLLIIYYFFLPHSPYPLINPPGKFDLTASKAKIRFTHDAQGLIKSGFEKVIQSYRVENFGIICRADLTSAAYFD